MVGTSTSAAAKTRAGPAAGGWLNRLASTKSRCGPSGVLAPGASLVKNSTTSVLEEGKAEIVTADRSGGPAGGGVTLTVAEAGEREPRMPRGRSSAAQATAR